ncbi:MAG: S-layer homology domain-containing protein [Clostridiales bacterium]|nr:S-layer homology domain-containing protein [Clostridiales bacterium]
MRKLRLSALLLALVMLLCILPVSAAESSSWLVPKVKGFPGFADVKGTWCESYVETVYQAGLMEGKSTAKFDAASPLTGAQIAVITARLHSLLRGGDGVLPAPGEGEAWYQPAVDYLNSHCEDGGVREILRRFNWTTLNFANTPCTRLCFVTMLAGVLPETLSTINEVRIVPDSTDARVLAFYRAGILNGSDDYGTFGESASLTRGAAAAMLARLVDPAQRLTFTLKSFDLCRDVLGAEPETVLLTVDGKEVTAALFANQLCTSLYQRKGGADKTLTDAIQFWCDYHAPFQVLAEKRGISLSEEELAESAVYAQSMDGYLGLSAAYWQQQSQNSKLNLKLKDLYCEADWKSGEYLYHSDLEKCSQSLLQTAVPTDALRSMDLRAVYQWLMASPFITWNFQNQ